MKRTVKFDGMVYARSSRKESGPPGEAEVLALNPQRRELILEQTGWDDLFPGTLNLKVSPADVEAVGNLAPSFEEGPVTYPEQYASIPIKRGGYCYYSCRVKTKDGAKSSALLRRCKNPHKDVLEVLAPTKLRDALSVADGAVVNVRLRRPIQFGGHYFRDAAGEPLRLDGMYHDAHAFLVCSGPSFRELDRRPLAFCWTLCTNNAVKACMPKFRPSAHICVDGADKFLHTAWEDPRVLSLAPDTHQNKWLWNSDTKEPVGRQVKDCPNVVYWQRTNGFNPKTFLDEPGATWGNNKTQSDANGVKGKRSVMLCSIKLLYALGFRHVYLLGADFNMDAGGSQYSFDQAKHKGGCRSNNSTYKQLDWRFTQLHPHLEAAGMNVYNCNPDSNLHAFDHLPYEDALARALAFAGDWREYVNGKLEDTADLYDTKWFVCPDCGQNARYAKTDCKAGTAHCACGRAITEQDRKKYAKDPEQRNIDSDAK